MSARERAERASLELDDQSLRALRSASHAVDGGQPSHTLTQAARSVTVRRYLDDNLQLQDARDPAFHMPEDPGGVEAPGEYYALGRWEAQEHDGSGGQDDLSRGGPGAVNLFQPTPTPSQLPLARHESAAVPDGRRASEYIAPGVMATGPYPSPPRTAPAKTTPPHGLVADPSYPRQDASPHASDRRASLGVGREGATPERAHMLRVSAEYTSSANMADSDSGYHRAPLQQGDWDGAAATQGGYHHDLPLSVLADRISPPSRRVSGLSSGTAGHRSRSRSPPPPWRPRAVTSSWDPPKDAFRLITADDPAAHAMVKSATAIQAAYRGHADRAAQADAMKAQIETLRLATPSPAAHGGASHWGPDVALADAEVAATTAALRYKTEAAEAEEARRISDEASKVAAETRAAAARERAEAEAAEEELAKARAALAKAREATAKEEEEAREAQAAAARAREVAEAARRAEAKEMAEADEAWRAAERSSQTAVRAVLDMLIEEVEARHAAAEATAAMRAREEATANAMRERAEQQAAAAEAALATERARKAHAEKEREDAEAQEAGAKRDALALAANDAERRVAALLHSTDSSGGNQALLQRARQEAADAARAAAAAARDAAREEEEALIAQSAHSAAAKAAQDAQQALQKEAAEAEAAEAHRQAAEAQAEAAARAAAREAAEAQQASEMAAAAERQAAADAEAFAKEAAEAAAAAAARLAAASAERVAIDMAQREAREAEEARQAMGQAQANEASAKRSAEKERAEAESAEERAHKAQALAAEAARIASTEQAEADAAAGELALAVAQVGDAMLFSTDVSNHAERSLTPEAPASAPDINFAVAGTATIAGPKSSELTAGTPAADVLLAADAGAVISGVAGGARSGHSALAALDAAHVNGGTMLDRWLSWAAVHEVVGQAGDLVGKLEGRVQGTFPEKAGVEDLPTGPAYHVAAGVGNSIHTPRYDIPRVPDAAPLQWASAERATLEALHARLAAAADAVLELSGSCAAAMANTGVSKPAVQASPAPAQPPSAAFVGAACAGQHAELGTAQEVPTSMAMGGLGSLPGLARMPSASGASQHSMPTPQHGSTGNQGPYPFAQPPAQAGDAVPQYALPADYQPAHQKHALHQFQTASVHRPVAPLEHTSPSAVPSQVNLPEGYSRGVQQVPRLPEADPSRERMEGFQQGFAHSTLQHQHPAATSAAGERASPQHAAVWQSPLPMGIPRGPARWRETRLRLTNSQASLSRTSSMAYAATHAHGDSARHSAAYSQLAPFSGQCAAAVPLQPFVRQGYSASSPYVPAGGMVPMRRVAAPGNSAAPPMMNPAGVLDTRGYAPRR